MTAMDFLGSGVEVRKAREQLWKDRGGREKQQIYGPSVPALAFFATECGLDFDFDQRSNRGRGGHVQSTLGFCGSRPAPGSSAFAGNHSAGAVGASDAGIVLVMQRVV